MSTLGSLNPKYYYIDENGEIKKYVYCRLCHAGPFKLTEDRKNFMFFGMGTREPFCLSCATIHKFFKPVPHSKKYEESEETKNKIVSPFKEDTLPAVTEEPMESDILELE